MHRVRGIRQMVAGARQTDGAGVRLVRVLGPAQTKAFDPFLMLDAFDSRNPDDYVKGFPWHPHRGIETVTYLIAGHIEHGDSLGNQGAIRDGSCQWMTAGSGIVHQEMPQASPHMLGLQLWVNLPRKDKMTRPQYRDLVPGRIPKVPETTGIVHVIAGTYGGVHGATQGDYVKVRMLDVALKPDTAWSLDVDPANTVFLYLFEGDGIVGELAAPMEHHRAVLLDEGSCVAVRAGASGLRFMLMEGRPLREPIAWGGPIVMNTREELSQAFAELEAGTFIRNNGPNA